LAKIHVLGIGPGSRDYLPEITKKIAEEADVLIGGKRALELFSDSEQQKIRIRSPLDNIKSFIKDNYQNSKIAVLVSGDPGLYSLLNYLKRELEPELFEVIPGISSLQLAAAELKLSWNDLKISSLHGNSEDRDQVLELVKTHSKVGLFTDSRFPPSEIAAYLMENCIKAKELHVFENLSYADQKITSGSLEKISSRRFSSLSVMIILDHKEKDEEERIDWDYKTPGIPDDLFIRGEVPMTKEEVRAVVISKLRLQQDHLLYDIGAGSGSISVEAALQSKAGTIYAVEKKAEAAALIKKNIEKFKLSNVKLIQEEAPAGLDKLPAPDRIFIGGSGGNLKEIISFADKKLKKEGRIVITAVTLNTLSRAADLLEEYDYQLDISNIAVTKTKKIKQYQMFKALNPVYIISAQKEEV
jgi:precorrin-6y C5,15-methyltransferase (decarboxylating) CbiE subunit/precorrin-6Y C5,15-methyltransferase (decarboxylating) CbiT subunit